MPQDWHEDAHESHPTGTRALEETREGFDELVRLLRLVERREVVVKPRLPNDVKRRASEPSCGFHAYGDILGLGDKA